MEGIPGTSDGKLPYASMDVLCEQGNDILLSKNAHYNALYVRFYYVGRKELGE